MADQTFTAGQVLTAAQMTTLQQNSGLVFVKGVTQVTSVASINVTSCFSATFDAYRVVISSLTPTSNSNSTFIYCKLLSTTTPSITDYNYAIPRVDLANGAVSATYGRNATTGVVVGAGNASDTTGASFDVLNPFSARYTNFNGLSINNDAAGYAGAGSGMHAVLASYNGFQISASTGNISNAAIMVYGYRYLVS
jgi:hypothetical protein